MRNLLLLFTLLFTAAALAQDSPKLMTKVVVQFDAPEISQDAFIRKPKVMYRAGARYCRIEEALDAEHGLQQLAIINEPDAWMINLVDKKGRHVVDPGPTFNCHLPVFSGPPQGSSDNTDYVKLGLEFGSELEFFKTMGATPQPGPVLQTKETTSYFLDLGDIRLALFTYGPDQFPLLIGRTYKKKGELYWYSSYGQIRFDPKLFAKPAGVTIEEMKP
jgi:hypothetical protein